MSLQGHRLAAAVPGPTGHSRAGSRNAVRTANCTCNGDKCLFCKWLSLSISSLSQRPQKPVLLLSLARVGACSVCHCMGGPRMEEKSPGGLQLCAVNIQGGSVAHDTRVQRPVRLLSAFPVKSLPALGGVSLLRVLSFISAAS